MIEDETSHRICFLEFVMLVMLLLIFRFYFHHNGERFLQQVMDSLCQIIRESLIVTKY